MTADNKEQDCNEIDFYALGRHTERIFVPADVDMADPGQVVLLYENLLDREIDSANALEGFIHDRSELDAALDQQSSILYIRMTCQTDDPARAEQFKKFTEEVLPAVKPLADKLDRKYLAACEKFDHDADRYAVYDKGIQTDIDLFRKENVDLETQDSLLTQEYQTICGAMTVEFDGKEQTMPAMRKYLQQTDREMREKAWRAMTGRRLADSEKIDDIFDKMILLREKIAKNADCENFRDYRFLSWHRFDYTPADCRDYHSTIEKCVVPLLEKIYRRKAEQMSLDKLRPWDTVVDPQGKEPLKPFADIGEFVSGMEQIFKRVDNQLGEQFADMASLGLLDLASRKGKAPGGYQCGLNELRKPFIFMNSVCSDDDLRVLLHEGGHAFHTYACQDDPLVAYRQAPLEFCEVASMSMELLGAPHLDVFYNEADAKRSRRDHLHGVIQGMVWVAIIDSFQHWLYENPTHTRQARLDKWQQIHQRYIGRLIDQSGLEEMQKYDWQRIPHIFQTPFYYIEYGIAQIGALQMWRQSKKDRSAALDNYRNALAFGGAKGLADLFGAADLKFGFTEDVVTPLVEALSDELDTLYE